MCRNFSQSQSSGRQDSMSQTQALKAPTSECGERPLTVRSVAQAQSVLWRRYIKGPINAIIISRISSIHCGGRRANVSVESNSSRKNIARHSPDNSWRLWRGSIVPTPILHACVDTKWLFHSDSPNVR